MSDDPRYSSVELRQLETRDALIELAMREFDAGEVPSIVSVCEALGITRPRLYRIWPDVEAMYAAVAEHCLNRGLESPGADLAVVTALANGWRAADLPAHLRPSSDDVALAARRLFDGGAQ